MNEDTQAPEAIAVIGMAGRFPGASNPDEFWQNLIARLRDENQTIARLHDQIIFSIPHHTSQKD